MDGDFNYISVQEKTVAQFKVNSVTTLGSKTQQGNSLSPLLFSVAAEPLVEENHQEKLISRIKIGGKVPKMIS